jgi:hypothetical protein
MRCPSFRASLIAPLLESQSPCRDRLTADRNTTREKENDALKMIAKMALPAPGKSVTQVDTDQNRVVK